MNIEQNPFNALPNISLAHELLDSPLLRYLNRIQIDQVWPDGSRSKHLVLTVEESPSQEDIDTFRRCIPTLAWVTIQACPVLVLPRSNQYSTATGKSDHLVLQGTYETVYPKLYCVERGDIPTLLTTEEIIQEGSLRPDMTAWLNALRGAAIRRHDSDLDPLYAML